MAVGEVWRIRNVGTHEFKDSYNGNVYRAAVGSDTIVPVEAGILWLGNPNTRDIDPRRLDRTNEFKRLRVRYGAYDNLDQPQGVTPMWDNVKPKVEAFTLDGDRVLTVVDDPFGELTAPVELTHQERISDNAMVTALQSQMAEMQSTINQLLGKENEDPDSDPAHTDAPPASALPAPAVGTARPVSRPVAPGQEAATVAGLRPPANSPASPAPLRAEPGPPGNGGKPNVPVNTPVTEDRPSKIGVS